jgi:hypothetical protein
MSRYAIRWDVRRLQWLVAEAESTVVLQAFDKLYEAERWACASDADRQAEAS